MLPANGLTKHLGDKSYWPIYEEAERLGRAARRARREPQRNYGMDTFSVYTPINGLGHPFGQMVAMSSLVFHGVFDEFPTLRVAFLEAGSAWVGLWMDRMDRSYQYHVDLDASGKPIKLKEKLPSDYFKNGRVFVGCEGSEQSLPGADQARRQRLVPVRLGLPARSERQGLPARDRRDPRGRRSHRRRQARVLCENAERFYDYTGVERASARRRQSRVSSGHPAVDGTRAARCGNGHRRA